jgi:hypothetical protein
MVEANIKKENNARDLTPKTLTSKSTKITSKSSIPSKLTQPILAGRSKQGDQLVMAKR